MIREKKSGPQVVYRQLRESGGFNVLHPCLHVPLCGHESEAETSKHVHLKRGIFPGDCQHRLQQPCEEGNGHPFLLLNASKEFFTIIVTQFISNVSDSTNENVRKKRYLFDQAQYKCIQSLNIIQYTEYSIQASNLNSQFFPFQFYIIFN